MDSLRSYLTEALTTRGHRVVAVGTAQAGLAHMLDVERVPDAVILDLVMPDGHGTDVLREAREAGFRSPVILSSGYTDSQVVDMADNRRTRFLPKPYGGRELDEALSWARSRLPTADQRAAGTSNR